jgi:hypothetical protein
MQSASIVLLHLMQSATIMMLHLMQSATIMLLHLMQSATIILLHITCANRICNKKWFELCGVGLTLIQTGYVL